VSSSLSKYCHDQIMCDAPSSVRMNDRKLASIRGASPFRGKSLGMTNFSFTGPFESRNGLTSMRKMPRNFAVFFMLVFNFDISFRDAKAM
jgi:hypothetical protein